jgi:tetratricopeptide (TPR) repeat protein
LTKQLNSNPDNPELYYDRSIAFANMEAFDNAIADMQVAMKIDSLKPKYYAHLSDLFLNYSRSKQALATLQAATERFPTNIPIRLKYSELLITLKQNQRAVFMLSKVMEQDNQNADAFFLMGLLMREMGENEKAKKSLKEVVSIDPEITDAYIILGELYENDDPKLALQYLENAITVDPLNINALHSKAFFLQNNDRVPEALEIYRKINVLDPNYAPAFLNAGILLLEEEELDRAYEQFNIFVGIAPTDPLAYFYRGYTLYLQDKLELAKKDLEQSLVYDADNENTLKVLNDLTIEMKRNNL